MIGESLSALAREVDAVNRTIRDNFAKYFGQIHELNDRLQAVERCVSKLMTQEDRKQPGLLSCPFCGSDVYMNEFDQITCNTCHANGPCGETREDTIKAWNRRP